MNFEIYKYRREIAYRNTENRNIETWNIEISALTLYNSQAIKDLKSGWTLTPHLIQRREKGRLWGKNENVNKSFKHKKVNESSMEDEWP